MLCGRMKTVRVSVGSAVRLGLKKMKIDCLPTTVYVMTPGVCRARCLFCSQWVADDRLSRVQWPEYGVEDVVSRIEDERVCIQCLNYETVFHDVVSFIEEIEGNPISVSAQPFSKEEIAQLKGKIDRISINMDCATPELFSKMKPYYTWENHLSTLLYAAEVFGPFKASSHLMAGLGETEEEMVQIMKYLYDHQISSSLFAFTPVKGTPLEKMQKPSIAYYRRLQVYHYLIHTGKFTSTTDTIPHEPVPPEAFTTRGCPGCNRPYYTETPRNVYNFPCVPSGSEIRLIEEQLRSRERKLSLKMV